MYSCSFWEQNIKRFSTTSFHIQFYHPPFSTSTFLALSGSVLCTYLFSNHLPISILTFHILHNMIEHCVHFVFNKHRLAQTPSTCPSMYPIAVNARVAIETRLVAKETNATSWPHGGKAATSSTLNWQLRHRDGWRLDSLMTRKWWVVLFCHAMS